MNSKMNRWRSSSFLINKRFDFSRKEVLKYLSKKTIDSAYNKISSDTNRYYSSLEIFLYDLSNILSRHIHNKK